MHPNLITYLETLTTPGEKQRVEGVFVHASPGYDWAQHEDDSVHGILLEGSVEDLQGISEGYRVLKPGGHMLLASPQDQPTGHSGACFAEDTGFEVRDCIVVPDQAGDGDHVHYVAKPSTAERESGLLHLPLKAFGMSGGAQGAISKAGGEDVSDASYDTGQGIGLNQVKKRRNHHPTVKSRKIMECLLADVPLTSLVVDPFMGSGTTGLAVLNTGHDFLGIEREEEYLTIADGRIRHWCSPQSVVRSDLVQEEAEPESLAFDDLFDF